MHPPIQNITITVRNPKKFESSPTGFSVCIVKDSFSLTDFGLVGVSSTPGTSSLSVKKKKTNVNKSTS